MKTAMTVFLGLVLGALALSFIYSGARRTAAPAESISTVANAPDAGVDRPESARPPSRGPSLAEEPRSQTAPRQETPAPALTAVAASKATGDLIVKTAVEKVVSPQLGYDQKQAAWQQLREAGKLDLAITELEQRSTANPAVAEYPAALGQAYLHKAGSIQDVREQGILGLKADQSFDAALSADPSNWEARFWKATAMSYWPTQMNKSGEVVEHYLECVRQQEVQPPQPQFAQTYLLLGEQYQRMGFPDYASEAWKRGLALFPDNARLQQKIAAR